MKWLVIAFCIMIAAAFPAGAAGGNPTLTVVGEGTANVPADIAIISASVHSGDENMTAASSAVQGKMAQVIDALKAAGVKDDEIVPGQSSGVTSYQSTSRVCKRVNNSTVCENGTTSLSSLERSIVIRLKSTDETRINHVLDAARSAGAEAEVAGYSLSDPSKAATQARQNAVADAKENALAMAGVEGLRLGKVVDISDYGYPMRLNDFSGSSSQPGTVDVTSYVLVTYEIEV